MSDAEARPIVAYFVFPPIPSRDFDWCATRDNYEEGDPAGWGSTKQSAIDDFLLNESAVK